MKHLIPSFAAVAVLALAACGGGGSSTPSSATPTPAPGASATATPTPIPTNVPCTTQGITLTPCAMSFTAVGQSQTFTVLEENYSGVFNVSSTNNQVATVAATGSPAGSTYTVTATGAGYQLPVIKVTDSNSHTAYVTVTVTTTNGTVQ